MGGDQWGGGGAQYGGMDPMGGGGYNMGGGEDGGFLNDANTQSANKGKKFDKPILPVTVRQLQMAPESEGDIIKVDGVQPGYYKIVGTIESVEEHATVITYMINDTTGTIKCIFYLDKDDGGGAQRFAHCRQDSFVRVVGLCRSPGEDLNMYIYNMQPVSDFNEVTHHMLETIYCHNLATKGPIPGGPNAVGAKAGNCKSTLVENVNTRLVNSLLTLVYTTLIHGPLRQYGNGGNRGQPSAHDARAFATG